MHLISGRNIVRHWNFWVLVHWNSPSGCSSHFISPFSWDFIQVWFSCQGIPELCYCSQVISEATFPCLASIFVCSVGRSATYQALTSPLLCIRFPFNDSHPSPPILSSHYHRTKQTSVCMNMLHSPFVIQVETDTRVAQHFSAIMRWPNKAIWDWDMTISTNIITTTQTAGCNPNQIQAWILRV